ncbi:FtsK/SpoIIIE domain-containing protein [Dactylosporangium sp. NPDC049525]|uniref:FtsK/SpoIIIE domain-containing protein n=1 Tax=Dactylosporangium sp. NPDC049525 TaxID=3154730 RepID=UPI003431E334
MAMPLVNVIRGERIEPAPFNVRTPYLKVPLWLVLFVWLGKGLLRLTVVLVRHWVVTGPLLGLAALYVRFDWYGPVVLVLVLSAVAGSWWQLDRATFLRFGFYPLLGRWRRWRYRRQWLPSMVTAGLGVSFNGHTVIPEIKRVRSSGTADVLTVRMVTGQIPDDFAKVSERLTHTFGARACRVSAGSRPDLIVVTLLRGDPLAETVAPFPVPPVPDFRALELARREDGDVYALRLFGTQVLVVGATDAGKGSVIWSLLRALAAGIRSGLVQVWAFDPKGGMELASGMPLFARFACEDFRAMADMLEEAVATMRERTARLRGRTRQHTPSVGDPLIVIVIDELAALTAYLTDRQLKDRIKAALGVLLTQGRAVGVHVVACLQDPRKEVLPFRDLFPTRIGLRLTEEAHVDLTLGEGARDRGALCDRIPRSAPGVAYVVLDGDPTPMRVRFSYLTDDDITDLAYDYARLRPVDRGGAAA